MSTDFGTFRFLSYAIFDIVSVKKRITATHLIGILMTREFGDGFHPNDRSIA